MSPLFQRLWDFHNAEFLPAHYVTAELLKDVDAVDRVIPQGTRVRVWMASRFGDVGISDNLNDKTCHGYCARVGNEGNLPNVRNPGSVEDYLGNVEGL